MCTTIAIESARELWENKFTQEIKCPRCGRIGTLSFRTTQSCGKKGCIKPHKGLYWRIIHKNPRKECYLSRKMISTGGVLPHILRKKRRALEFKQILPSAKNEGKTEIRKRSKSRAQLQQVQMPSTREIPIQPTPSVQTEPLTNLKTKRVEEQPTATFTFSRDGNYVTVRCPSGPPVVVLLTRHEELYCGGCAKTDCIHTQAVRQWLKKDDR